MLLALLCASHATAASLFDPALRFRVLSTDHFVIYFHQGEDRLARRLATIAEETWTKLQQPFSIAPPRRTHVVLADQSELANGYATPLPRNTIVMSAAWPLASEPIGDTDDWLRLVFTHEFTHIVHLDRSEGWARAVRTVFGRSAIALPNLYLPTWQIEGLATYEESVITGAGRLHAGDFSAIVGEEARARALQPLDRINGGLTDWPGGTAAYAYGLGFHQYLADRFGAATLGVLADATARRVPYTTPPVFKRLFGESLGTLWREYQSTLLTTTPAAQADAALRRVTHHGFAVAGPRFDRFECNSCLVYAVRTPDGFPALNRVRLDGSAPSRATTRYFGASTAIGRDELYFDQQEIRRSVGTYSDLYVMSRTSGRVRRVTKDARLMDPDLSPDGTTLACVQARPGQRDLVMIHLPLPPVAPRRASRADAITTLVSEPETQFNAPRWSPDGRSILVERHRRGALSDVVLVDIETKNIRVVAADPQSRIVTPTWRPDGRAVVVALAAQDQPFNLYEIAVDGGASWRQVTHTTGGATWPDISPDGRTIAFVGYTVDGLDLFTMPYPGDASDVQLVKNSFGVPMSGASPDEPTETPSGPYSPMATLLPTSWSPIVEGDSTQIRVGAAVGAYDVLGYHFYSANATWLVSSPAGVPKPSATTPDWSVLYAYDRWQPTFWTAAHASTSFLAGPATDTGVPTQATLREREVEAGVVFPIHHVRVSHTALVSALRAVEDYTLPDRTFSRNRGAIRGAWATMSPHSYGYSISPEGGISAGATAEAVRTGLGAFADATTLTGDVRAYLPSIAPHHVVAVRLAGGTSTGDPALRRTFHLGGALPDTNVIDFGRSAISLLRGFGSDTFAGNHVALLNADYRFPIARPQRGVGTWPLFVHTVHGAVFADAGHAWTRTFRSSAIKTSVGAELSAKVVVGYFFPFTATVGAAWGRDGSGSVADHTTLFFRLGRAF